MKFWVKNQSKCARRFEMLNRTQVQLWYNRFKESREDVYDDWLLILVEQWRKWFCRTNIYQKSCWWWYIFRLMPSNFHGYSEDCSKVAKILTETTSHRHRSGVNFLAKPTLLSCPSQSKYMLWFLSIEVICLYLKVHLLQKILL